MSFSSHFHQGPWLGPPWWYEPTQESSPTRRPRRRREDLEDYLNYLEDELKRVRRELEALESTR